MNDKIKLTVRSVTFNLDKNNSWLITVSDSFHKRVSYIVNGHLSEMALAMHTAQWLWFLQWLLLFNSMEGGKIIFFLRYIFFFKEIIIVEDFSISSQKSLLHKDLMLQFQINAIDDSLSSSRKHLLMIYLVWSSRKHLLMIYLSFSYKYVRGASRK